jgi:hypothetical protein
MNSCVHLKLIFTFVLFSKLPCGCTSKNLQIFSIVSQKHSIDTQMVVSIKLFL